MKTVLKRYALALAGAGLMTLQGCGGGSTSAPAAVTVSGLAASGAAFAGATITVKDSSGATVGTSGTVGADGLYTVTLSSGAKAPFVLIATRTSLDGASESLVSVVPAVTGNAATANITPVTHLIASRLTTSGDPLKLAAEVASSAATVNATTVSAKVLEVQAILAPVLTATNTGSTDPLTGTFAVNGSGYDRLLDSIKVTIIPSGASSANIEVGVKQQDATEGAAPTVVQFASSTATPPSLSSVTSAGALALVPDGTAAKIAAHLAQLNTCFALPTATRVNNANPTGTAIASASASAADITAPECRGAFFQDGSGNILFKSNGATIGAAANRPFRGLFFDGGTGVTFSQGAYEFTRANGDIVVSYRSVNAAGAETFDVFALRLDPADGKLKQIGNQYNYPGKIAAYHQYRRFITLGQSAWDYLSTGYNVYVDNLTSGGAPVFDRVVVTTPRNTTLVLKPTAGSSYLVLQTAAGLTRTSFVRLRGEYLDASKAADDPATKDNANNQNFFADRTTFTNDLIRQIPMQAVWKYEYFLAGNTGTTPDATQHYKTRARALTIPELQTRSLATLTAANIAALQSSANPSGAAAQGQIPVGGQTSFALAYDVPAGALPPTSMQLWGRYGPGNIGFNDSVAVASTASSGSIACSNQTSSDVHCVAGAYESSSTLQGMHLWAKDPTGREYTSFYATYFLP